MALPSRTRSFSFVLLLFVSAISTAAGGALGVNYGRVADYLIPPPRVVELLKAKGIGAASIYDANVSIIQAFRDSGIKLTISLPNEQLRDAARDPNYAATWVRKHVGMYFPATQIVAIYVGNEVCKHRPDLNPHLLPAMRNVYNAIKNLGYHDRIKVSTPFAFDALGVSFPPSKGSFRSNLQPLIRQILEFLDDTGSYFTINPYPYFVYRDNYPKIDLDYFLGQSRTGVQDPDTKLVYYSLFDAMIDATYSAMGALRRGAIATRNATVGASLQQMEGTQGGSSLSVGETGCPNCGPPKRGSNPQVATAGGILNTSLAVEKGCSIRNAQAYNSNLVRRIVSGRMGTPLHPNADFDVYIFALFNENRKLGLPSERSFGLFYPDGTKVYDVPFPGPSWCVANRLAERKSMQAALDWACGQGGADCGPIQAGSPCYEPNRVEALTSWAMNSYYQRQDRTTRSCDFSGVGRIVNQRPRIGNCGFSSSAGDSSWCVADPRVGTKRMQAALDWACGDGGADCEPIQSGARCYKPNTVEDHASWAMNSYYQKRGHGAGTCNFRGVGRIVLQRPRYVNCALPG